HRPAACGLIPTTTATGPRHVRGRLHCFALTLDFWPRAQTSRALRDGQTSAAIDLSDNWIPSVKPPANVCPEKFCFYWTEAGAFVTPIGKLYATVQDAFPDLVRVDQASCRLGPGHCS